MNVGPSSRDIASPAHAAAVIDRAAGHHGELVLRRVDGHFEIISNGVFLMDTRDGRSERLLVTAAVAHVSRPVRRLLLGGLGVGFSLAEALAEPDVDQIVVVECEPAVVTWNRRYTAAVTGGSVEAPRVSCEMADVVEWLQTTEPGVVDVVCLDVDNGPDWLVGDDNGWLYAQSGIAALRRCLRPGGALSVWSSSPAPVFARMLSRSFDDVVTHEVTVARGAPDTVIVARAD